MSKITYFFIRMWAPAAECDDPTAARYVARLEGDGEGDPSVQWTVTKEYTEGHFFKHLRTAVRVLRAVRRLSSRVELGWLYEIIQVDEEIVGSNVPEEEKEPVL
jgi:hypothetical protein